MRSNSVTAAIRFLLYFVTLRSLPWSSRSREHTLTHLTRAEGADGNGSGAGNVTLHRTIQTQQQQQQPKHWQSECERSHIGERRGVFKDPQRPHADSGPCAMASADPIKGRATTRSKGPVKATRRVHSGDVEGHGRGDGRVLYQRLRDDSRRREEEIVQTWEAGGGHHARARADRRVEEDGDHSVLRTTAPPHPGGVEGDGGAPWVSVRSDHTSTDSGEGDVLRRDGAGQGPERRDPGRGHRRQRFRRSEGQAGDAGGGTNVAKERGERKGQ